LGPLGRALSFIRADARRALFTLTAKGASIDEQRRGTVEAAVTAAPEALPDHLCTRCRGELLPQHVSRLAETTTPGSALSPRDLGASTRGSDWEAASPTV
jgi:hypothetical protein